MVLCKIDIEENSKCKMCCVHCEDICFSRCVFAKFNNYENGIRCDNKINTGDEIIQAISKCDLQQNCNTCAATYKDKNGNDNIPCNYIRNKYKVSIWEFKKGSKLSYD